MTRARRCLDHGQSLVEVLVTLGLLTVLSAVVYPCFVTARRQAHQTRCIANLRQVGQGLLMYVEDYSDYPLWMYQLHPGHVSDDDLFACAADPFWSKGGWMQYGCSASLHRSPRCSSSDRRFDSHTAISAS